MKWQTADVIEYGILKDNAKANRNKMTEAEATFWSVAKSSGLGQKCRRQYVIGPYIVDFFFRSSLLIVELDGKYHFTKQQQEADAIRQTWLEQQGYKVLRFTNEAILFDTAKTIATIKRHLQTILPPFSPRPSPFKGDKRGSPKSTLTNHLKPFTSQVLPL